jgi:hypothetical protein
VGQWDTVIVDIDAWEESGTHWINVAWVARGPTGAMCELMLWEQYSDDRLIANIKAFFQMYKRGRQNGNWECGYFTVILQLILHALVQEGGNPAEWARPEKPPPMWFEIFFLVMDLHGVQTSFGVEPESHGLNKNFKAYNSAQPRLGDLRYAIAQELAK